MKHPTDGDQLATLKIGAVARLTGVSVHTLRKWEDRYAAVQPRRTEGGERVYTRPDLKRLALIKRLSDAGLSLREIAKLTLEELEAAWEETAAVQGPPVGVSVPDTISVAILGDVLPEEVFNRWLELTGAPIYQVYGSTEVGHVAYSRLDGAPQPKIIGKPLKAYRCLVADPKTLELVPEGQVGELLVSAAFNFKAYLNQPEESSHSYVTIGDEVYYRMGDLVSMDANGESAGTSPKKKLAPSEWQSVQPPAPRDCAAGRTSCAKGHR